MAEQKGKIEQDVEAILAGLEEGSENKEANNTDALETNQQVIDVDLYRLQGGAILLVPNDGTNPLDNNAVESEALPDIDRISKTPTIPLVPIDQEQAPAKTKRAIPRLLVVALVILVLLGSGTASYFFLLPAVAQADVTITPTSQTIHQSLTIPVSLHPGSSEVQGRLLHLAPLSLSKTVNATGFADDPATPAAGVITFYNADVQPHPIPAGVRFSVNGVTVVTDEAVNVQAVVPPMLGTAYATAHVLQAGAAGNIPARAINTRCCGSEFITATNATSFTGGRDERKYTYVQSRDIKDAVSTLVSDLTPKATTALTKQLQNGEHLVNPVCSNKPSSDRQPGEEAAQVKVTVVETCSAVIYSFSSLQSVVTRLLVAAHHLSHYQQIGTPELANVQVTTSAGKVSISLVASGAWFYQFTPSELTRLKQLVQGQTPEKAQMLLEQQIGIDQASIDLHRLDFRNELPGDPGNIHIKFLYFVS